MLLKHAVVTGFFLEYFQKFWVKSGWSKSIVCLKAILFEQV